MVAQSVGNLLNLWVSVSESLVRDTAIVATSHRAPHQTCDGGDGDVKRVNHSATRRVNADFIGSCTISDLLFSYRQRCEILGDKAAQFLLTRGDSERSSEVVDNGLGIREQSDRAPAV